jgi:hypothetical protein
LDAVKKYWMLEAMLVATIMLLAGCSGNSSSTDGGQCDNACKYYSDCPGDQDCVDGCCKRSKPCANDFTCQPGGLCVDSRCVTLCGNDTDCPDEASCVFGFCTPYPTDILDALDSPAPDESQTEKKPLKVGIGDVALDFPVGVSMWGFGARLGPRTPYRDTLGGSDSMWDRPRAKAFVFDNGKKRIILVRAPMGCSTDFMAAMVAWRVYQATGENYLNRLVFSAPHSHSEPARFWNIFVKGASLGVLGTGDFSYEIFYRLSTNLTEAVLQALDNLEPARFGYAINEHMDPEGKIHHYRRGEYPDVAMDDNLVVMRIDDADGNPRAALVNMALHGTHLEGTAVSMDAPGGVELTTQQKLQEQSGLPVKVAFLARCSGDVSPAGDGSGLDDWRKVQEVGVQAWPKIKELFDSLDGKTTSDVEIDIANRRVPINRETLGYGPDEFYDIIWDNPCSTDKDCQSGYECINGMCGTKYYFGAFQCVSGSDEDPTTLHEDGHLGCIFSAETLAKGRPIPQFQKARMSVLRIGDLGMITVPGEPLSQYGRDLTDHMKAAGFKDATILGYSQDHHLYVMHADNWMQGGYEPSMGIWGWKEGDYFFDKINEMTDLFASSGGYTDDAGMKPTFFEFPCTTDSDCDPDPQGNPMQCGADSFCIVQVSATSDPGTIVSDVAATVERISMARLIWSGGHPGVDLPRMTLERDDGGSWVKATNSAGVVYSDDGFDTMTFYRGDYKTDHSWELDWETSVDFPLGHYRIHIEGKYFDGSGTQSYQLNSQAFDLVPCSRMAVFGLGLTSTNVSGWVSYPPGPTNNDGLSDFSSLQPAGFLRHSGLVPATMPWPAPADGSLKVDLTIKESSSDPVQLSAVPVDQSGNADYVYVSSRNQGVDNLATQNLPASGFSVSHTAYKGAGSYSLTVTATDALGNSGSQTTTIELQ